MVGIVDLGTGNLFSLIKALKRSEINFSIVQTPEELSKHQKILLPGVGAFPAAVRHLTETGIACALDEAVKEGKAVVGICLGMQLFMESSDEFSFSSGLGFIKGKVRRLPPQESYRRPNIGWNEVFCREDDDYLRLHKITDSRDFYFAHSYFCDVEKESNVLGYFNYGSARVPAVISNNQNLIGLQFHPEISGPNGIRLLSHILNNI